MEAEKTVLALGTKDVVDRFGVAPSNGMMIFTKASEVVQL